MTKISKTQQEVLRKAKAIVDYCRTHTLKECAVRFVVGYNYNGDVTDTGKGDDNFGNFDDLVKLDDREAKLLVEAVRTGKVRWWFQDIDINAAKNGIVTVEASSASLKALERAGLIKIIELRNGAYQFDTIQLLNY